MNILEYYNSKVRLLNRYEDGNLDQIETLDSLKSLNRQARANGLPVSDDVTVAELDEIRTEYDESYEESYEESFEDSWDD